MVFKPLAKTTPFIVVAPLFVVAPVTLHVKLGVAQASEAVASNSVPTTVYEQALAWVARVVLSTHVIVGGVVSETVMVCV